jgi:adenine-specific DNA-methyltransferase
MGKKAGKKKGSGGSAIKTAAYRHPDKRPNIPPAKIAGEGVVPPVPRARYSYSPHLPPVLRFDPTGQASRLPELVAAAGHRPLRPEEQKLLAEALRIDQPWLEWAGKREQHDKGFVEVDPVALHIHERVSAQAILRTALREEIQRDLFADPQLPYQQAVQFYRYDVDWANRLVLGDCLEVMSSLARRENLASKVQMIYMDPPYGIKFSSNFQAEIGRREVKEKERDLTRESEMVRAYRDTWKLGVHSYLAYLRDRLIVARDLLAESGSIFVQISDENLHRVRALLDEVFGDANFVSLLTVKKTGGMGEGLIDNVTDYLLWYCRDRSQVKYRRLYMPKVLDEGVGQRYSRVELIDGQVRPIRDVEAEDPTRLPTGARVFLGGPMTSQTASQSTVFDLILNGRRIPVRKGGWKTNQEGMIRLDAAGRLLPTRDFVNFKIHYDDFPAVSLGNLWADTMGTAEQNKVYVVQTTTKVVQRCLLMTTDPGDLVLDPTCGSGTTAYVAEQWGRRWITIDTSRVAIAIARQRLLTTRFEHYKTMGGSDNGSENPGTGFEYKKVPHITLKSIAQNTNLDPIFAKHEPILEERLKAANAALVKVMDDLRARQATKLTNKQKTEGKRAITDADRRRWELPKKGQRWEHWHVPFDTDPDWPKELQDAVTAYRKAWRTKMDEVNACIQANAEQEELVDQPEVVKGVVRVSGPFTVEGVRPAELSLDGDGLFGGAPDTARAEDDTPSAEPQNVRAYLTRMVQALRTDGVTFLNNKQRKFARLEPLFEASTGSVVHAEGAWEGNGAGDQHAVAVGFGPQYGPVTAEQVEALIRASRRYDDLVIAGFSFDAAASAVIQEAVHPKLRIHQAYIRPDLNPGMDGLLKDSPKSQLFTVFGQPEVVVKPATGGEFVCVLKGVDIYDPIENVVRSSGADKVAAWFLDSDYDGRCFCITQAFFPDQDAWEKIAKALGSSADLEAFDAFKGTNSLPFKAGKHRRVAVKVIDPRGNEVMAVQSLKA